MKTVVCGFIVGLFCAAASFASGALPLINVTVADTSGKVAYKGTADGKGTFATGKLQPGAYIVYFNSRSAAKGRKYALLVSAGTKRVMANAVEAEKFAAGGVAMRIDVAAGLNITGQVVPGDARTSSGFKDRDIHDLQLSRMAHQLKAAQSRTQ